MDMWRMINTKAADRTLNAGHASWRNRKVGESEML